MSLCRLPPTADGSHLSIEWQPPAASGRPQGANAHPPVAAGRPIPVAGRPFVAGGFKHVRQTSDEGAVTRRAAPPAALTFTGEFRPVPRHDFLPARDAELAAWAARFAAGIAADPGALGLAPADAAEFQVLADDYAARLHAATAPDTRTRPTVAGKNDARAALRAAARRLARIIHAHPGVTDVQRVALNLSPRAATGERPGVREVPPPATRPHVSVDPFGRVRLRDESARTGRGKPPGAWGALLFAHVGDAAPATPEDARFAGIAKTPRHAIPLPPASAGRTLWVFARWVNDRGQSGPAGPPARTILAA